jgi:hypothetical protein
MVSRPPRSPALLLSLSNFSSLSLLAGLAALSLSCGPSGPTAYQLSFADGQRAESSGRFVEAAHRYDEAAQAATRPRDRDEARWDGAQLLARAGLWNEAVGRYDAIAADGSSEHQAEAAYRAALARIEHGDADRGWREMEQVPRRFPSHGVAHVAVRKLVERADAQGTQAGLEVLHALERDLGSSEVASLIAYLEAEHTEALGDAQSARDAYVRIADRWPYPFGGFFDDSLWHASLLDEKLGRPREAVDDLERMLKERETTTLVGSYERPKYVPAAMRVGVLYRDVLHDHPAARAAFHRLYSDFAHSTMRDDALWLEAGVARDDGDTSGACDALGKLVGEFPDSRYVPCAVSQCPGVARPQKSGAPKECHAYLLRPGYVPAE